MLRRLLGRFVTRPPVLHAEARTIRREDMCAEPADEALAFLSSVAAAMPRLYPPAPANDDPSEPAQRGPMTDPVASVRDEVEQDLKQAGFLG